jgi:hypothetical protein
MGYFTLFSFKWSLDFGYTEFENFAQSENGNISYKLLYLILLASPKNWELDFEPQRNGNPK